MAKKNRKSNLHFFSAPFSLRLIALFGITSFVLFAINIQFIQKQWKAEDDQETANRKKMAQVDIVKILGETTIPQVDEANFKKKKEVSYWYSVVSQKPEYRDAYLILATLAYNDHQCEIAKKHLSSAFIIDPVLVKNNPIFQKIDQCGN